MLTSKITEQISCMNSCLVRRETSLQLISMSCPVFFILYAIQYLQYWSSTGACVTVVVSAIRARARINNIKANSVILRLFFSFSFHLKQREIKLRCRSNMPQPDSQRIILISNELQNIYLELFQIEFQ